MVSRPVSTPSGATASEPPTGELLRRIARQAALQGTALENSANAVVITDAEGAIFWTNPAFSRISGYAATEVLGRKPSLLKSGRHDRAFYRQLWRTVLNGRTWKGTLTNRRKDGTLYHGEQTITPVRDEHGVITHLIAVMNDITERQAVKDELRATHAQLQHLLDHSPAVTYGMRFAQGEPVLHAVSNNVRGLLGYGAAEITGTGWWTEHLHPDDGGAARAMPSPGESDPWCMEYRLRHADGSYRWIEDTRREVPRAPDTPAEFVGHWYDITERKRAEAVMRAGADDNAAISRGARRELAVFIGATVLFAVSLATTDILHTPVEHLVESGHLADEVLGSAIFACFGLAIFGCRRWREARVQIGRERELQAALRTLHAELDQRVQQRTAELAHANAVLRTEAEQRRRAEAERGQDRQLMRTMIDQVPDLIYVKDPESRFQLANDAIAKLMGVTQPAELLGRTDADFHPAEQAAAYRADEVRVLAGESILEKEEVATDGSGRVFLTTKLPRRDADGRIIGVIGIGHEITERRFVERALRLFRAQVDESSDTFEVIDPATGQFLDVSTKGPVELGCSRDDYLSRRVWEVDSSIDEAAWLEMMAKLRADGALSGEGRHRRADGTEFPIEFNARWVRLDREYVVTVVRDISARKKSEEALRNSQAMYHSLVEQMPVGIFRKDLAGRYVYVNDWFCRKTGLGLAGYVGRRPSEIGAALAEANAPRGLTRGGWIFSDAEQHHADLVAGVRRRIEVEERWGSEGAVTYLQVVKTPVFDSAGNITGSQGVLFDVTEQKRSEAGLRETESRFRQLAENVHEVFWLTNPGKTEMLYVSPGYERVWGRSCASLLAAPATWLDAVHPDDRARVAASTPQQARGAYDVEYRVLRPDGSERWIRDRAFPVRDEEGRAHRVAGVAEDITEWKQAAEDLRRARDQYRSIFENSIEGIYQATPEGVFLAANPALARILGYVSVAELMTERRDVGALVHLDPARRLEFEELIEAHGAVAAFEYEACRRDGSRVWLSENAHLIRDESGRSMCYEGTLEDITDRKRAELRLRLQHAVTAVLAEAGSVAHINRAILATIGGGLGWEFGEIWSVDRANNVLRCLEVHQAGAPGFAALEKRTRALQMPCGQGLPGEVWATGRAMWTEATGADARCLRGELAAQAGLNGWIGFPIRLRNEVAGVIGFFSRRVTAPDATLLSLLTTLGTQFGQFLEREQLAEQFRQAQKLEAIGTLAGGIAHDFNNIIAAISGYAELALMANTEPAFMRECIECVRQAGGRAAGLVRQILAFSRQQEQQRAPIQLRHVVREATNLLRATIPTTIEFHVSLDHDLPTVLADATQIHQVVMNLGTNAWHAMREHPGRLDVRLEHCVVDAALAEQHAGLRPGNYVRLGVSDTGHGMDAATIGRIFEPFFTTKTPGEGTGLGLSVVHGIMQSHDGVITVSSQCGQGTTFQLYFPACAADAVEAGPEEMALPRGSGERVLFVDDEEALASVGRSTLEKLGYQVDAFSAPQAALAALRRTPADYRVVITDFTMPGLTGVELAREVLAVRPDLPVLLITGHNGNLTASQVEALGIRELLLKPLSLHGLALAVRRVLNEPKKG